MPPTRYLDVGGDLGTCTPQLRWLPEQVFADITRHVCTLSFGKRALVGSARIGFPKTMRFQYKTIAPAQLCTTPGFVAGLIRRVPHEHLGVSPSLCLQEGSQWILL